MDDISLDSYHPLRSRCHRARAHEPGVGGSPLVPLVDVPGLAEYGRRHTDRPPRGGHPAISPTRKGVMKRQNIQRESLSKRVVGGHVLYSHVVVVEGKKTIFISGQLARGPSGEVVGPGDMRTQLRQVGENIKAALAAAGATLADIVKTNTYVTDIDEFFKHVDVRMEYFGALPTSTTVEVRKLAHPDLVVEVEAIAVVD